MTCDKHPLSASFYFIILFIYLFLPFPAHVRSTQKPLQCMCCAQALPNSLQMGPVASNLHCIVNNRKEQIASELWALTKARRKGRRTDIQTHGRSTFLLQTPYLLYFFFSTVIQCSTFFFFHNVPLICSDEQGMKCVALSEVERLFLWPVVEGKQTEIKQPQQRQQKKHPSKQTNVWCYKTAASLGCRAAPESLSAKELSCSSTQSLGPQLWPFSSAHHSWLYCWHVGSCQ